eukprot:SAG11_NODE_11241_length_774_cov_1.059259_1_plen_73_part_10
MPWSDGVHCLCSATVGTLFVMYLSTQRQASTETSSVVVGRHTLAGIFDGRVLQLYIDGKLAAQRAIVDLGAES